MDTFPYLYEIEFKKHFFFFLSRKRSIVVSNKMQKEKENSDRKFFHVCTKQNSGGKKYSFCQGSNKREFIKFTFNLNDIF